MRDRLLSPRQALRSRWGSLRFPAIVEGGTLHGVYYYFVDDPEYFDRDQLYGWQEKILRTNATLFGVCGAAIEFWQARLDA